MVAALLFHLIMSLEPNPFTPSHPLNLCMNVVNDIQQSVLVASNLRVVLLCGCPAIKQLAHGHDNLVVRAIALQHEQHVRHLDKAQTQRMRCAHAW
jgi:hypothetical protein